MTGVQTCALPIYNTLPIEDTQAADGYVTPSDQGEAETVPYMLITNVDGVQVKVTAEAGVVAEDAQLSVARTGNKVTFTEDAEKVLNIEASETTLIRHTLYSFTGAELNGTIQVEMTDPEINELKETYPEGKLSAYVLNCKEEGEKPEDRAT